jgi:hypothetical protein
MNRQPPWRPCAGIGRSSEIRDEVMHPDKELLDCDKPAPAIRRAALLKNH